MATLQERLLGAARDAYAMEQSIRRLLDSVISATADPELVALLERHRDETDRHELLLAERLSELGDEPASPPDVGAFGGSVVKTLTDQLRGEQVAEDARDVFAAEHFEIAAYELLERLAVQAGDERTADVARRNCAEERAMVAKLDTAWDRILELSLVDVEAPAEAAIGSAETP